MGIVDKYSLNGTYFQENLSTQLRAERLNFDLNLGTGYSAKYKESINVGCFCSAIKKAFVKTVILK